jgi:deoxyribodipyrimidine photo-lyase
LRLHDAAAAAEAHANSTSVLPVFLFDPTEAAGGSFRASFVAQSVLALRAALRAAGSDLLLRSGRPEALLPALAKAVGAVAVHATAAAGRAGRAAQAAAARALDGVGVVLRLEHACTLHAAQPFAPRDAPRTFAAFRAALLPLPPTAPQPPLTMLRRLPLGSPEAGEPPQWALDAHAQPAMPGRPRGGEAAALQALALAVSAVRAGGSAAAATAQLAPWLALGCLSPRRVHAELAPALRDGDAGGAWLSCDLLWRDFFSASNLREALSTEEAQHAQALVCCDRVRMNT